MFYWNLQFKLGAIENLTVELRRPILSQPQYSVEGLLGTMTSGTCPVPLSRASQSRSAIVLWSGASRPSNHINSMFRRHSDSSRRAERICCR